MKFKLYFTVTSSLTGIDLDDEYDRLGFNDTRHDSFVEKQLTFEVDKQFAKDNRELFGGKTEAIINVDSSMTTPDMWDDYGYIGNLLSYERVSLDTVMSLYRKNNS